jgi:hypothetical protein
MGNGATFHVTYTYHCHQYLFVTGDWQLSRLDGQTGRLAIVACVPSKFGVEGYCKRISAPRPTRGVFFYATPLLDTNIL